MQKPMTMRIPPITRNWTGIAQPPSVTNCGKNAR
jgi:hypothetical protein